MQQQTTRIDAKATTSLALAIAALVASAWVWWLASALAVAALVLSILSRQTIRRDPEMRGAGASLAGLLLSLFVLVFVTVGPPLLTLFLFAWAR